MLDKPDLQDDRIAHCLRMEYGVLAAAIHFLPLGADRNTAVYRVVAEAGTAYFLKLRRADFAEVAVTLPKFLYDLPISQIIPPLPTLQGRLWTELDGFAVILYPFVEGRDGYEVALPDAQWAEFGAALRRIHEVVLPEELARRIPRETFPSTWREVVSAFLRRVAEETFEEPLAPRAAVFLAEKRDQLVRLVARTEALAEKLRTDPPPFNLCHFDLHAGNLLINDDAFYIVDWDNPILAPKERDLMFIGGGLQAGWHTPEEEETLFYRGYGPTQIDHTTLAYYRYARIIEDIAIECEHIFDSTASREEREREYHFLKSNFNPGSVLDLAYRSDPAGVASP